VWREERVVALVERCVVREASWWERRVNEVVREGLEGRGGQRDGLWGGAGGELWDGGSHELKAWL